MKTKDVVNRNGAFLGKIGSEDQCHNRTTKGQGKEEKSKATC